mgnify:CR=1 FL=1
MNPTPVHMIMGSQLQVPLILIIVVAFIIGYATALFSFVVTASRKKKKDKTGLPERYDR